MSDAITKNVSRAGEHYSFESLSHALEAWVSLERQLSDEYDLDPSELLDTLEGETSLYEAISALDEFVVAREIELVGLKAHIDKMTRKLSRRKNSLEVLRNTILQAMDRAGIPTVTTLTGTISVKKTPRALVVEDESAIPTDFWKPQDPTLDKKALLKALKDGQAVPGAQLNNGGITLQIRRS